MHTKGCRSAIILVAGVSSRYYGEKNVSLHKSLSSLDQHRTDGKTLLSNLIEILAESGVESIYLVTRDNNQFEQFRNLVELCCEVELSNLSSSGSVAVGLKRLQNDCTLIIDGDLYFGKRDFELIYNHMNGNCILLTPHTGSGDECVPVFSNGKFVNFSKEKKYVNKSENPEYVGISHFESDFIRKFMEMTERNEFKLPYENVVGELIKIGFAVNFLYHEYFKWKDLDTILDLESIRRIYNENEIC